MEQKKKIIITVIVIPFIIGLAVNFVYDKIKNHSSSANRKSGLEFEFKVKFKFFK